MTAQEAEQAIRAAGCGWSDLERGSVVLVANETPGYCNAGYCQSVALVATRAGASPAELGQAVFDLVNGDDAAMRAILALAQ